MERVFQAIAVVLIGAAAIFWLRDWYEWSFVAGVLGAGAFFLATRVEISRRLKKRAADAENEDDEATEE